MSEVHTTIFILSIVRKLCTNFNSNAYTVCKCVWDEFHQNMRNIHYIRIKYFQTQKKNEKCFFLFIINVMQCKYWSMLLRVSWPIFYFNNPFRLHWKYNSFIFVLFTLSFYIKRSTYTHTHKSFKSMNFLYISKQIYLHEDYQ